MASNPETFERKNQKMFGRWSRIYDGFWFRLYFGPLYRHTIQGIKGQKQDVLRNGGSMLDIACGTAEIVASLAVEFPRASFTGIDLTPAMVAKAQHKTRTLTNVTIQIGTAQALPFADTSFDVVLISEAFHHMAHPEMVMREVRRVLKGGGLFLLVDPAQETPLMLLLGWLFKPLESAYQYYTQPMLRQLFEGNGLVVARSERHRLNNFMYATVNKDN